ncbi:DENND4C [Symbiodinium sp. CCMP2592]|nr:DENND4C [Symbiodinium sp. CCMP2592]
MAPFDSRLIRYLAVLGPEAASLEEELERLESSDDLPDQGGGPAAPVLRPITLERFPEEDDSEVPLSPLLATLPDFCFKEGLRLETAKPRGWSPAFASFAFTTGKGGRLFVACLIVHERVQSKSCLCYTPKAFCLVSLFPCLELFRNLLADLVLAARSDDHPRGASPLLSPGKGGSQTRLSKRLVAQIFFDLPVPANHSTMVSLTAGLREVTLLDPSGATRDFSFRPLVACLSEKRLAQLFVLVLLERKVVLTSKELSHALLAAVLEVLRALIFPFEWEHTYIPILPASLRWTLESPAPFLMGVPGGLSPMEIPDDVVLFDLDTGRTIPEKPQMPPIPKSVEHCMTRLRTAHQWEQRDPNKDYWKKFHTVRFANAKSWRPGSDTKAPDSPSSSRGRHRRSLSSTSCESGEESDGALSLHSSGLLSGSLGPVWNEDQERSFRQKVSSLFLEAMILLLHRSEAVSERLSPTQAPEDKATRVLLEDLSRTNAWERFLALPANHPRRQLFDQAVGLGQAGYL